MMERRRLARKKHVGLGKGEHRKKTEKWKEKEKKGCKRKDTKKERCLEEG